MAATSLLNRSEENEADRLKRQCASQAVLMTRFFAAKLVEQGEIVQEAMNGGSKSAIEAKLERFQSSIAWIEKVVEPIGMEEAISREIVNLRAENARLSSELESKSITRSVPSKAERRILELQGENIKLREEIKIAKTRILERDHGRMNGNAHAEDTVALKKELANLRQVVRLVESGDAKSGIEQLQCSAENEKAKDKEMIRKLKAKVKDLQIAHENEKEQLMTAMEKEVESLMAEERKAFDKEKEKLERSVAKAKKKSNTKAITTLAKQVAILKPQIKNCRQEALTALKQMSQFSQSITDQVLLETKKIDAEFNDLRRRYTHELKERRRLHNLVQELRGNIRVFCRVRPPSKLEIEHGDTAQCVSFPNDGEISIENGRKHKTWTFDRVFDFNSSQDQIYSEVSELVISVLDGYNVCIFAYGQTGSGKTFTMTGPLKDRGCNLKALTDLFARSKQRRSEIRDTITVTVIEVYNEQIRDLLAPPGAPIKKLEVRRNEYGNNHVPGLTTVTVQGDHEVLELMQISDQVRAQASTNMNDTSSRSHMIMSVLVESRNIREPSASTRGMLHLVDLAGSERLDKSGATGQALKEAQNINKSLSALGDVIAARAQGNSHIPFRNSTLTHLLQDSLSQDSKTLMFCCISPVLYNADESTCTLNFASRVGTVELGRASKNALSGGSAASSGAPKHANSSGRRK
mmetsp:Transcript_21873/g.33675  ORF Transcript_21873/g.33675 Transcript_21873/m.33675 type:complete len:694 (-) Transcript_21873:1843-3924(-)|eukprot:CAMPEP_0197317580 /NCGR_PEP_ID=MMETSP0891-20130614/47616_1 /TAXON_ID=44058 ORGANISM="Aureoumbra lagunensis, Strain CCMP1510" /NCGR_SAMPLE_ID=MMETSP0891 /ASSEMBLY_ACC=CAM_ASM_000534 /LENGTH=693 /DNA_ID=CAMNT_0042807629 /DNA_START=15 /DNA_END=2096 /DNA_ORIENTATION=+